MIAGIGGGAGGGSAVEYITDEKRHEIDGIEYRNLASDTPVGAKREMLALAACSEKCEKPIMHTFLSWPPDERPSKEQMFAAMDLYLEKLGLADRQAVYAIHHEKGHLHVHAAVNRVGSEGNAWETWRSKTRAMAVVREVERELGFQELGPTRKVAPRTNDAQAERLRDKGIEPTHIVERNQRRFESLTFADSIRFSAAPAITSAASWPEVHANLRDLGLEIVEYKGANAKRTGFEIVEPLTSERCAASKINKTCGRKQLEARLGVFEIPAPTVERTVERAQPVAVPIPQALRIVELHRTRERVSEHLANVYRDAMDLAYRFGMRSVLIAQKTIGNAAQVISQAVNSARDYLAKSMTFNQESTPVVGTFVMKARYENAPAVVVQTENQLPVVVGATVDKSEQYHGKVVVVADSVVNLGVRAKEGARERFPIKGSRTHGNATEVTIHDRVKFKAALIGIMPLTEKGPLVALMRDGDRKVYIRDTRPFEDLYVGEHLVVEIAHAEMRVRAQRDIDSKVLPIRWEMGRSQYIGKIEYIGTLKATGEPVVIIRDEDGQRWGCDNAEAFKGFTLGDTVIINNLGPYGLEILPLEQSADGPEIVPDQSIEIDFDID